MNVLLTNISLTHHAGTEVYVRDLSIALHERGFGVEVYSPHLGAVADEIRTAGIHVADSTRRLRSIPDIIHAHHFKPAIEAILRFPRVPAVYFAHDRLSPYDVPPKHSQIKKYVAVDLNCLERLTDENGISEEHTTVLHNWVDLDRFRLRERLSEPPLKAAVFSNYGNWENYAGVIRSACESQGIALDGVGLGFGNPHVHPENILGNYDIVFAKAKAAMEALATGACVIVCDFRGLGGIVTNANFEHSRRYNFGMKTLTRPVEEHLVVSEIQKYDAAESLRAARRIREEASFEACLEEIVTLYNETIQNAAKGFTILPIQDAKTLGEYRELRKRERSEHRRALVEAIKFKVRVSLRNIDAYLFNGAFKRTLWDRKY